jgi:(p)ppGpp synthase/HD superfamily hydrolase
VIAKLFGEEIAQIVEEITDDKTLGKEECKRLQVEHAVNKSKRAKLLKLADKISNLRSFAISPAPDWSAERRLEYVRWARDVAAGLNGVSEWLKQEFEKAALAAIV